MKASFRELDSIRREVSSLLKEQDRSLRFYHITKDPGGFRHKYTTLANEEYSKASTATCVLSLISTGAWAANELWSHQTKSLAEALIKGSWKSAGLPEKNPFTVAFILEAVTSLSTIAGDASLDAAARAKINDAESILKEELTNPTKPRPDSAGAAGLKGYPPSPYVTQLVVRALRQRNALSEDVGQQVKAWAWRQIEHELALRFSKSKTADAYSLAYSAMTFSICSTPSEQTPDEKHILNCAIDALFDFQLLDGSWPRGKPLFHYPLMGNAYCYEYEMLTQLLQCADLQPRLLLHIDKLMRSARRLPEASYPLEGGGFAWASGHHPQERGPESWSTASVYHFLYEFDRLLAEAVRRSVFGYVRVEYQPPGKPAANDEEFSANFLDSDIKGPNGPMSLTKVILDQFAKPLAKAAHDVELGRDLDTSVPISAIFFGPPGTSKTQLAKKIARYLNWSFMPLDPSHLVRRGQDQIQAETNRLFGMLATLERVVVLFDEFDEMVRDRASRNSETLSRFLTTAMLPKLTQISDRRRIVFIIATNFIDSFDFAIRRPGRFDLILQLMPPTLEAKFAYWESTKQELERLEVDLDSNATKDALAALTFLEFKGLAERIARISTAEEAAQAINDAYERCTLKQRVEWTPGGATSEGENSDRKPSTVPWADVCTSQEESIRLRSS